MKELSLRERKHAGTKAALLNAILARLGDQTLDDIAVKDVCREVMVSEATFFNYFASKQDVIIYSVQLWSIEVAWEMQAVRARGGGHLEAIRTLFEVTAAKAKKTPGLMAEILARQALMREPVVYAPLTLAEYREHFPGKTGIEAVEGQALDQLILGPLAMAQEAGELPQDVDPQVLGMSLIAIFFVTPVLVTMGLGEDVGAAYRRQLDQLLPR
jgi:AcrR family transcriptional regulator